MAIIVSLFGLIAGFLIGGLYVIITRGVHRKGTSRKSIGFSHSESVKLQADSNILRSSRVERSAEKYKTEED